MKHLIVVTLLCTPGAFSALNVTVIGTGYVGLVTSAYLAERHNVTAYDIDTAKIRSLQCGKSPLYEPGLDELLTGNRVRLDFTSDCHRAVKNADIIMLAVGTPSLPDGGTDLRALESAALSVAQNLDHNAIIIIKSTVPVGTTRMLEKLFEESCSHRVYVVSNPEFLREGCSVYDVHNPDRIVIGTRSMEIKPIIEELYRDIIDRNIPCVHTTPESAEMIKYAANAFLAMKISFANELARICDATGASMRDVRCGIGLDHRINPHFLMPGPGFGGSCFPKDVRGLIAIARLHNVPLNLIPAIMTTNDTQQRYICEQLRNALNGSCAGKTIAICGIAFKANTDDTRESPAVAIMENLAQEGALIRVYDPVARLTKTSAHGTQCESWQEAASDADALMILTEWPEFANISLAEARALLRNPIIIDARGTISSALAKREGFTYRGLGSMDE